MKRLLLLLLIFLLLLTSCNSLQTVSEETSGIEIASDNITAESNTAEYMSETGEDPIPEITWHYPTLRDNNPTWMPADTGDYPDKIKNTYLTFPLVDRITANGFDYMIEFYTDTVYLQDYIYLRVTVTNTSDSLQWYGGSLQNAGAFKRDDGEMLMSLRNNGSFSDDTNVTHGIDPGTSHTYEALFPADCEFFNSEHSYVFVVGIYPIELVSNYQRIEIPISINVAN